MNYRCYIDCHYHYETVVSLLKSKGFNVHSYDDKSNDFRGLRWIDGEIDKNKLINLWKVKGLWLMVNL